MSRDLHIEILVEEPSVLDLAANRSPSFQTFVSSLGPFLS